MGEESWPENVVRSKGELSLDLLLSGVGDVIEALTTDLEFKVPRIGKVISDGPRPIICADCGTPIVDGNVVHMKPETYAITYKGETFYLERHLCIACAEKRGVLHD